jgi:glutamate 5-kinase
VSNPARFEVPARVVAKVGSSSLRAAGGGLDRGLVTALVDQIAGLRADGIQVVLVSSGAVAAGLAPLGLTARPGDLPSQQAAASVGQGILMHTYQEGFGRHGLACGQVLLTPDDVVDRTRYLNARHTFDRLLELGAVPVVNENDTVVTDELRFGDNDRLAALVASMLNAQVLVLLSDVDGLYPGRPGQDTTAMVPIDRVDDFGALDPQVAGPAGSDVGTGGMASKLEAARIAAFSGAHTVIANARRPDVLRDTVAGSHLGTWFPPSRRRPESRKLWIAFAPVPRGSIHVDAGAVRALVERGSSLLAAGIVEAGGEFEAGDAVDVVGPDRRVVARGLTTYSTQDVHQIRGRTSDALQAEFGVAYTREVIHRDSLVIVA